ncbi:MAG: glycoside hydrolase family 88 protein [Bacteroidaceae bacterium]|nr:glycoside hydrolase family 88 protein [Bacteroidaceae bacterium]
MKNRILSTAILATMLSACGAPQGDTDKEAVINDSNTPLHLMQPEYKTPYGVVSVEEVKEDMDRVLHYLESCTPTRVVNEKTGETITDYANMGTDAQLERGTFRLASYEWGVTYSAMLAAAEATGDQAYMDYVINRFNFLAEVAPYFRALHETHGKIDPQMRQILDPHALDDAGAVCAAMVKAQLKDPSLPVTPLIENYINYIMNGEYRLADGTFARTRPFRNTVWLDDMFMGIPPVAWYSVIAGDEQSRYQAEAVRQVLQFAERMWVPEKNLFRHGWVESMEDHPSFHWGRANGWAILTMCEVLDVLPEDYPKRDEIMTLYRKHVRGLAALQSGEGFWHQLLDRNDSYLETSATAIYAYCIAHGINKGWLDAMTYGPVAMLAWHAVTTQIDEQGQVGGTCVGTGMAFDPAFYYYRPVHKMAAHGYGPVIWAGAEVINLLKNQHPKMNDSAVQFYRTEQKTDKPIFHEGNVEKLIL